MTGKKIGRPTVPTIPSTLRLHINMALEIDKLAASLDEPISRPEMIRRLLTEALTNRGISAWKLKGRPRETED